ncbi:MAG: DUF1223 domain-containing protein [Thermoanaerobaculia bacterium]|nr:DUF1223 domain-containing protein [Thermoanaerobaculia bacterium]
MRSSHAAALVTAAVTTLVVSLVWAATRSAPSGPRPEPAAGAVVILELFTSQGCSSCPPADRVLSALGNDPALAGRVLPLAFHVDYWNHIGWTDPFSSPEASARQRAYADAFDTGRIYTPQLVVGGTRECVGSNESAARELIAHALGRAPRGTVALTVKPDGRGFLVTAQASLVAGAPAAELLLAVVESGLETAVPRGENARRRLANDHVVRRFFTLGSLPAGGSKTYEQRFDRAPEWRPEQLSVVAFLQDPESREILAAGSRKFPN